MNENMNLLAAVNAVMKAVAYVQKGDYNEQQRYKYAGEAAIIASLRTAMVDNGLMIVPEEIVSGDTTEYNTKSGTLMHRTDMRIRYRLYHTSGESLTLMEAGTGMDAGDKDAYKALTGAYKYALRHVFCLETGDDPDKASPDDQTARKPRTARAVQPARDAPPDGMIGNASELHGEIGDDDGLRPPLPATPPQQPASARNVAKPDGTAAMRLVTVSAGERRLTSKAAKNPNQPYVRWEMQVDGQRCYLNYYGYTKAADLFQTDNPETYTGPLLAAFGEPWINKGAAYYTAEHIELVDEAPADQPSLSKGE